jgi:hypothetical protein
MADKTTKDVKSRTHVLRVIKQYSSEEYWNHPTRKYQIERAKFPQAQQ